MQTIGEGALFEAAHRLGGIKDEESAQQAGYVIQQ